MFTTSSRRNKNVTLSRPTNGGSINSEACGKLKWSCGYTWTNWAENCQVKSIRVPWNSKKGSWESCSKLYWVTGFDFSWEFTIGDTQIITWCHHWVQADRSRRTTTTKFKSRCSGDEMLLEFVQQLTIMNLINRQEVLYELELLDRFIQQLQNEKPIRTSARKLQRVDCRSHWHLNSICDH